MYRTLIAAAAFAAISFGTANVSHAQEWNTLDQYAQQVPADDVQGEPTGEEKGAENIQGQDRFWVYYRPYCWSRWTYVGYNWFGQPMYQRYVWCR